MISGQSDDFGVHVKFNDGNNPYSLSFYYSDRGRIIGDPNRRESFGGILNGLIGLSDHRGRRGLPDEFQLLSDFELFRLINSELFEDSPKSLSQGRSFWPNVGYPTGLTCFDDWAIYVTDWPGYTKIYYGSRESKFKEVKTIVTKCGGFDAAISDAINGLNMQKVKGL